MLVKINSLICGPFGTFKAGSIIDLSDEVAMGLIKGGAAVSLEHAKVQEVLIVPDQEPLMIVEIPQKKTGVKRVTKK